MNTYWETSVKQFFLNWRQMPTPLQHAEHFRESASKKLLTIDEIPTPKKNQQKRKRKRSKK
jgi:hypothetical protein